MSADFPSIEDECRAGLHSTPRDYCGRCSDDAARADLLARAEKAEQQRDRLRAALEQALASLRELRGLAWTGSRIPPHLYPEYGRANAADNAARAALKETT